MQQLTSDNITLNANAQITRGLYVPGEPAIQPHGKAVASTELPANGSIEPTSQIITMNSGSQNPYLISRIDPTPLTPIAGVPQPSGTNDVVLNQPDQTVSDFTTLRNLTLNGKAAITVPGGTYGDFTANGSTTLTLGVAGSTTPTVYNLQHLKVNGSATLNIVGPIVLNLENGTDVNTTIGSAANPLWLTLNVAQGDVHVNDHGLVYGAINLPGGTLTVNGQVTGDVVANQLVVNQYGLVKDPSITN